MSHQKPLCVDLDGTLIHSDLLLESFLLLLKRNPIHLFLVFIWLLKGKAHFKQQIASRVKLNPAALPYNRPFLQWLHQQKAAGRSIWLATASDVSLAQAVADHLQVFDGVLASDGHVNLAGRHKAAALVARFGEKGFDYCGNASVDLAIWAHSAGAVVVNGSADLVKRAQTCAPVAGTFMPKPQGVKVMAKALRVHQWAKNGLIFIPVAAAHQLSDVHTLWAALLAFTAFSLCASSVYLLNDMLDLEADRQHHSKASRPFASGQLSLMFGLVMAPVLLFAAFAISLALPLKFVAVLAAYYVATLAYSFVLKRVVMVDVLMLAGLYTVRIVAGAAATAIPLSFWLLMFAIFIFLSLALVKRYAELHAMKVRGKLKAKGRGYQVEDLSLIQSMGAASGYLAILVLALYLNSSEVSRMYQHPKMVWALVPLMLYWVSRIWMQTHRGQMHDDPLVFAMKDRVSLFVGLLAGVVLAFAV